MTSHAREELVSIKHKLRMIFLYLPLLAGALSGVPMRPEDMEKLMSSMNQEQIVYVIPADDDIGDELRPVTLGDEPR